MQGSRRGFPEPNPGLARGVLPASRPKGPAAVIDAVIVVGTGVSGPNPVIQQLPDRRLINAVGNPSARSRGAAGPGAGTGLSPPGGCPRSTRGNGSRKMEILVFYKRRRRDPGNLLSTQRGFVAAGSRAFKAQGVKQQHGGTPGLCAARARSCGSCSRCGAAARARIWPRSLRPWLCSWERVWLQDAAPCTHLLPGHIPLRRSRRHLLRRKLGSSPRGGGFKVTETHACRGQPRPSPARGDAWGEGLRAPGSGGAFTPTRAQASVGQGPRGTPEVGDASLGGTVSSSKGTCATPAELGGLVCGQGPALVSFTLQSQTLSWPLWDPPASLGRCGGISAPPAPAVTRGAWQDGGAGPCPELPELPGSRGCLARRRGALGGSHPYPLVPAGRRGGHRAPASGAQQQDTRPWAKPRAQEALLGQRAALGPVGDGALAPVPSGCGSSSWALSKSHPDAVLGSGGARWPPRCLPTSTIPRVFTSPHALAGLPELGLPRHKSLSLAQTLGAGAGLCQGASGALPDVRPRYLRAGTCPGAGDRDRQGLVAGRPQGTPSFPAEPAAVAPRHPHRHPPGCAERPENGVRWRAQARDHPPHHQGLRPRPRVSRLGCPW